MNKHSKSLEIASISGFLGYSTESGSGTYNLRFTRRPTKIVVPEKSSVTFTWQASRELVGRESIESVLLAFASRDVIQPHLLSHFRRWNLGRQRFRKHHMTKLAAISLLKGVFGPLLHVEHFIRNTQTLTIAYLKRKHGKRYLEWEFRTYRLFLSRYRRFEL